MSGGCTAFSDFVDAADGSVWDWVEAEAEAESEAEVDVKVEGTVVAGCVIVTDMFVCEGWWLGLLGDGKVLFSTTSNGNGNGNDNGNGE